MADWNTSSTSRSGFERFLSDPKKLSISLVGVGAVLLTLWALAFRQAPPEPEAAAVAFAPPDPSRALPPVGSGMLPARSAPAPKADPEADALKTLQSEALKEAAGPAENIPEEEASEQSYEAEDEAGAPGRPIAEGAAFLAGASGGAISGSLGDAGGASYGGGAGPAGAGGAAMQAPGGAAVGRTAGPERAFQGAAGAARAVSGGGRAMRSGSAGSSLSGAASGMGHGADRFAPGGSSGSSFSAGTGGGITTAGGANAYAGGAGGGVGQEGGGGLTGEPGGNPANPGGGGAGNPGGGSDPGGPAGPVTPKKRGEVNKDAKGVLKTATDYRRGVVAKIMAEERADLQALSQRSLQVYKELKAGQALLAKDEGKFAAFPQVVQNLSETRTLMAEQFEKFKEGGNTLKRSLKTLTKVPPQCQPKKDAIAAGEGGVTQDPAGVLKAHRDALQALRRIAVARVAVDEAARAFKADSAADEPVIRAADPKLADQYLALSKKVQKDLSDAGRLIPANLYPLKGKGTAAKKDLTKKLKPVKKAAEKGETEARRRASEIKAAHRAYPQTADLQPTEDAASDGAEAAHRVVADDPEAGGPLLTQAAVFLPPLVKAGEYAAESFMQQCDAYAGLLKLAKDAPK